MVDKKQKPEDKSITTSCPTKATSSLKFSPVGHGNTTDMSSTKISLEGVKDEKVWYNMPLTKG
jgi:hypothetical protein